MARITAWRSAALAAAAAAVLLACGEEVTAPGHCPELCPPDSLIVLDTVLSGVVVSDTSLRGYTNRQFSPVLVVANTPALTSYAIMRYAPLPQRWFPNATDTVDIGTIDSVAIEIRVDERDTTLHNTQLLLYRMPSTLTIDSTTTVDSVSGVFAGAPFDSAAIPDDTTSAVLVRRLLPVAAITPTAVDSFIVSLGIAVSSTSPTIVRLLANDLVGAAPVLKFYVHGAAPRDTFTNVLTTGPVFDSYVQTPEPVQPPSGVITVGNQPAARSFLRFNIPRFFVDSVNIVRATLLLTPTSAVTGIPGESISVAAQPILKYFAGKSILLLDSAAAGIGTVTVGQTGTIEIEVVRVLRLWRGIDPDSLPRAMALRNVSEEFTTVQLEAGGATAGANAPRLRISYVKPFQFGVP